MSNEIKKINIASYCVVAIFILGMALVWSLRRFAPLSSIETTRTLSVIILLGSALCSAAIPILIRMFFYRKAVKKIGLSPADFYHMKIGIIFCVFIGCIFSIIAYLVPIFRYHLYLSVFIAIYGVYSILPTDKTYQKDRNGFKVRSCEK